MSHLNIGPVYRVGQVEIGHSSKTSLIQETEGENLPIEWDFRPPFGAVNYCVFRASRTPGLCPGPTGGVQRPQNPAELTIEALHKGGQEVKGRHLKYMTVQNARIYSCYLLLLG